MAISNNVGSVKQFSSALQHALGEERHFALVDGLRVSNLGSLLIVRIRNSVRPSHLFDHQPRSWLLLMLVPKKANEKRTLVKSPVNNIARIPIDHFDLPMYFAL